MRFENCGLPRLLIGSIMILLKDADAVSVRSIYKGCGQSKTCLGAHENGMDCIETKCCHYLVSFHYETSSNLVVIQMQTTKVENYVSMGISNDALMGEDAVVQCFRNSAGKVTMESSRNEGKRNVPIPIPILFKRRSSVADKDKVFCELALPLRINTGKESFDLRENAYHMSIAGGPVSSDRIRSHSKYGIKVTKDKVKFTQIQKTEYAAVSDEAFEVLSIQIHVICMTLTWMLCIPVAIFMSRFYKETWADVHYCRRRLWFMGHSGVMLAGLIASLLGYMMIPISQKGLVVNQYDQVLVHQVLGYLALSLLLLQCCGNWLHIFDLCMARVIKILHVILGTLCYTSGLANIGFSYVTVPHHAPKSLGPLVITCVVVLGLLYIGMSGYVAWTDNHLGINGWRTVVSFPLPMVNDDEAPRPTLRKSILAGFIFCTMVECALTIYFILGISESSCESNTGTSEEE